MIYSLLNRGFFLVNDMPIPRLHFISGQIGFLVQKDAQCSETYEKTIFLFCPFLFCEKWSILYPKFLENKRKYHHKPVKRLGFKILSEERVNIIMITITWVLHFFTKNLFYINFKCFFE